METNIIIGNYIATKSSRKRHNFHKSLIQYFDMSGYNNSDKPSEVNGLIKSASSPLRLSRFDFNKINGFGKYNVDFTDTTEVVLNKDNKFTIKNTDNSIHVTKSSAQQTYSLISFVQPFEFKIKVTGLKNGDVISVIDSDSTHDYYEDCVISISQKCTDITLNTVTSKCDISIQQMSMYEGSLIFNSNQSSQFRLNLKNGFPKQVSTIIIKYLLTEPYENVQYLLKTTTQDDPDSTVKLIRLQNGMDAYSNFPKVNREATCIAIRQDKGWTFNNFIIGAYDELGKDCVKGGIYAVALYADVLTDQELTEEIDKIDPIPEDYTKCVLLPVSTGYDEYIENESIIRKTSRVVFIYKDYIKVVHGFIPTTPTSSYGIKQGAVKINNRNYLAEYSVVNYEPSSITPPTKIHYTIGQELDTTGMEVLVDKQEQEIIDGNVTNKSTTIVLQNDQLEYSGFDSSNPGVKEVVVYYRKKEVGRFQVAITNVVDYNDKIMIDANNKIIYL